MIPNINSGLYIEKKNITNSKYMSEYNLFFLFIKSL